MTTEGRRLLSVCKKKLEGSVWYDVLFPKPQTPEDIRSEALLEKELDRIGKVIENCYTKRK